MSTKKTLKQLERITGERLSLGVLLRSIREGEALTQTQFAAILGVSRQYLCDIEKGRRFVGPKSASFYAETLGYAPEQFVRLCIQDILVRDGIDMRVDIKAA